MLAAFVDEPARVTPRPDGPLVPRLRQLGRSATPLCFHLFDRTPHAWRQGRRSGAAGATSSSSARRSRCSPASRCTTRQRGDAPFLAALPLIERAATDERNFVKKGVSWALRAVGRRNAALNKAAVELSRRLAESPEAAARWVGKDAYRELASPKLRQALARRSAKA